MTGKMRRTEEDSKSPAGRGCRVTSNGGWGRRRLGVSYEPQRSYWLWDSIRTSRWLENWSLPSHVNGVFFSFSNVCVWGGARVRAGNLWNPPLIDGDQG